MIKLQAVENCKAVSLLSNMHTFALTLRCTTVCLYLNLTPTFPVAHYTVSSMFTLNWNVISDEASRLRVGGPEGLLDVEAGGSLYSGKSQIPRMTSSLKSPRE